MKIQFIKSVFILFGLLPGATVLFSQETYSLRQCLEYALDNNRNLKKSNYDREKAAYARQEVLGSLLPQISGSANLNDNLKKARFIMPNFVNSMLPPSAQDPDAEKYMIIEMGTTYNANVGVSLSQQVLNLGLFNVLEIAKTAEKMAALGVEADEEEVISQTVNLFYAVQSTEYAVTQMDRSVELVNRMLETMEENHRNGLVRKVDVDRLKVNLVNLTTQRVAVKNAAEVQKNLLKLQMGFDVGNPIDIQAIDLALFEEKVKDNYESPFSLKNQTSFLLLMEKMDMVKLQKKSAVYEYMPTLSLMFNYQYNGVSDEFFRGETNYWYPGSVVGLSLRIPVFSGFSRRYKISQNSMELQKAREDAELLGQSLNMAFMNARIKLADMRNTINLQRDNQSLAEEVFRVTENNFMLGLSSMSDILNAAQSLVQAQLSYAGALNDYMKAWVDLKKASGSIRDLLTEN
ncbi:MAG TPA: TolC family protein [Bacteroidales bacterium]|jgi:outer membrane protein TolC|nr:TolC family protein [Bacteroidales bacterium]HQH25006.1 TolC family protein [Bacteroidales bacterium]HQJ83059.1 TolC family protein [Bacteroidales bacterium]